ncbi:MAG: ATP-binding protein, partial [Bacteroidota bacterium]
SQLNYPVHFSRVSLISSTKDSTIYKPFDEESIFDYTDNSIAFSYSLPSFENSAEVRYSYKLDGFDEEWSSWSTRKVKEYTNLSSGEYMMKVRALNDMGQKSEVATYDFTIKDPWYQSIYAFILYILLFIGFVWLIVRLNTRRLKLQNETLEKTIEERTEEIRKQAEELKTLDNAKSRFFANISHELRTPLTLIQGPLDSILNGSHGKVNENIQSNLNLSRESTSKLLNLVEEILDLSKLEAGKLELNQVGINFSDLIHRTFFTYKSAGESRGISFELNADIDEKTILRIDVGKLEKILDNLLSNALKFSHESGHIKMHVEIDDRVIIKVEDNGVGIDKNDLDNIFNRFYQAGKENKYAGGTGIGLALAKELATLMDGTLTAESTLGEGTTFTLILPYLPAKEISVKVALEQGEVLAEEGNASFDPLNSKIAKILVVEDQPQMRDYIINELDQYSVDGAEDGLEALEMIQKNEYDLIITDLMMPRLDGMDLVANLKQEEATKNISVVMLTARAADEDIINGLTVGVDDYMIKPFNPQELRARVNNILTNRLAMLREVASEEPKSADDQLIKDLKNAVMTNLTLSSYNVSSLASEVAISDRQLNRTVKRITGLTAGAFIKEVRLNHARSLLENKTFNTVSEISYACGFEKPGYFTEIFSQRFGKRPKEYLG